MSGVLHKEGLEGIDAFRLYWRNLWAGRVNYSKPQASGRTVYGQREIDAMMDDAFAALDLQPTDWLIDIGCAKGLMGDQLRPRVARYVGIDYVFGMRPTVVGDAVALPLLDGRFDKAVMAGVLVCIPPEQTRNVLTEMRRMMKPGGVGFIGATLGVPIHSLTQWFEHDELMALALECGWREARITSINSRLPQAQSYFDMVVTA